MRKDEVPCPNILHSRHTAGGNNLLSCKETPNNRLDSCSPGFFIELDAAVHAAVVGERERAHASSLRRLNESLDARLAVQEAVLGMDVQMREVGSHGGTFPLQQLTG